MNDGDVVEMQGSGKLPYQLKRIGDTYSCSCPAWRNQSQPINRRSCKHLRKLLGDAHESARIGGSLIASRPTKNKVTAVAPALMRAHIWDESIDPTGMYMSEKLNGVRAKWTGTKFISRLGNEFYPPAWFTAKFPTTELDGELWMGRDMFQETVSIVRTQGLNKEWKKISYLVYNIPGSPLPLEKRIEAYTAAVASIGEAWVKAVKQELCTGLEHMQKRLAEVEAIKGEGLILCKAGTVYEDGKSWNMLKVKSYLDAEAIITGFEQGKGNRAGMVGAFLVEGCSDGFEGKKFKIGTGFTHAVLKNPPPIGTKITFKYTKGALSKDGLPTPAVYVGEAIDR